MLGIAFQNDQGHARQSETSSLAHTRRLGPQWQHLPLSSRFAIEVPAIRAESYKGNQQRFADLDFGQRLVGGGRVCPETLNGGCSRDCATLQHILTQEFHTITIHSRYKREIFDLRRIDDCVTPCGALSPASAIPLHPPCEVRAAIDRKLGRRQHALSRHMSIESLSARRNAAA